MKTLPPLFLGLISLGACTFSATPSSLATARDALSPALIPLRGCDDAEAYVRAQAAAAVERAYAEALDAVAKSAANSRNCNERYADAGSVGAPNAPVRSAGSATGSSSSATPKAANASGTNNQVSGVDEADFIKNDGTYMYVANNGALRIFQAFPGSGAHLVGKLALTGDVVKMLLDGDRVLVYTKRAGASSSGSGSYSGGYRGGYSQAECTYGYSCTPHSDGTQTALTIIDVSNKAAPAQLREVVQSGSLISARQLGHEVYTVTSEPMGINWSRPSYYSCSGKPLATQRAELTLQREAARTQVQSATVNMPRASDTQFATDGNTMCSSGVYRSPLGEAEQSLNVLSLDLQPGHEAPVQNASILSAAGHVYASAENLYVAVPRERSASSPYGWYAGREESVLSDIHKFKISATEAHVEYTASGLVKGGVLNQFAMDENDGYLRVATSYGRVPSKEVHSTLTVLDQVSNSLVPTGIVDHLAPQEDIRSVRFDGARGYIVTFKKTDPLYVFDLATPSAPRVLGELKIPGFSTYMHMLDSSHLLTIGYDANDHGDFAYFDGVILQIFDVSNPAAPTLAHKHKIGTRGSSSEALTNHLAFNYFAPLSKLAIPMTVCEGGSDGRYGTNMTFSGLMVFGVDAASGFSETGRIAHPSTPSGGYNSNGCGNWWENASSEVRRSVFMDNWVYSVSNREIRVSNMSALSAPVAVLDLTL